MHTNQDAEEETEPCSANKMLQNYSLAPPGICVRVCVCLSVCVQDRAVVLRTLDIPLFSSVYFWLGGLCLGWASD